MNYSIDDFKWMKLDEEFEILDVVIISLPYWFYPYALDKNLSGLDSLVKALYDGEIFMTRRLLNMGDYIIRIPYNQEHYELLGHMAEMFPHRLKPSELGDLEYLYKDYDNVLYGLIILNYNERKIKKVPFTFRCERIEKKCTWDKTPVHIDIDGTVRRR